MSEDSIYLNRKLIKQKWVIKELNLLREESGKTYAQIVYELCLEKLKEIQDKRNCSSANMDDTSMNSLRKEVNNLFDTYERKGRVYKPDSPTGAKYR